MPRERGPAFALGMLIGSGSWPADRQRGCDGGPATWLARDVQGATRALGPVAHAGDPEVLPRRRVAQSSTDLTSLHWSLPTTLPPGALAAVVSSDPNRLGESTFMLSMPNGCRIPPHFHPSYEHVEVRKGTLLIGMGDKLNPKRYPGIGRRAFGHRPGGDDPFLDRQGADRGVRDVLWPLYDHLPPRGRRSAAAGLPLRLLRHVRRTALLREKATRPPSSPGPAQIWVDPAGARPTTIARERFRCWSVT
jgi:hypothetical protein